MKFPLYIICYFSLAAFHAFSLNLYVSLMCVHEFLLGFILYGTLCFLDLAGYFLSHVWKVLTIMSSSVCLQVSFLNYSFVWVCAQE